MKVVDVDIKKIQPSEYNPRQASEKQYSELKKSIQKFGFVDPLIVNKRNSHLIGGHFRLRLAKDLKYKKVPVVYVNLNDKQEEELNLRLNKNTRDWDWEKLVNFEKDFLMDVGFDDAELSKQFDLLIDPQEDNFDADVAAQQIKEPQSKLGEVYQLGNHRLMCGDATKKEDVERLMDVQKADMVFTDPPYGVGYTGGSKTWEMIKGDAKDQDIAVFYGDALSNLSIMTKNDASWYICHAGLKAVEVFTALRTNGFTIKNIIIWNKNNAQFGMLGANYHQKHEPIIFGTYGMTY